MIDDPEQLRKLPLWKTCLEEMLAGGLSYGQAFDAEYFEARVSAKRDTVLYSAAIHRIREGLEHHGFYLSGRGLHPNGFQIVPVENNLSASKSHTRSALKLLRRTVTLCAATPLHRLNDEDRKSLEGFMEKASMRLALMQRPRTFFNLKTTSKPKRIEMPTNPVFTP